MRFSILSSKYSYEPLQSPDSIRVLELFPGRHSDRIRCELRITTRSQAPQYEALSYAWGDISEKRKISCGGSKLKIQKNLHDFLKRLRDPAESKIYWADAICINQMDRAEVGHQVRQMASIYSGAERVIVWLGCEDPSKHFDKDKKPLERLESISRSPSLDTGVETRSFLTALAKLLHRPWFGRLWVVQEAGLGKSVVALFGKEHQEINFDDFISLIMDIEVRQHGLFKYWQIPVPSIFGVFTNRYAPSIMENKPDFLEILQLSRNQHASDPRDFVFALLAHPSAHNSSGLIIEPDYQKSHWQIFHELSVTLLMQTQNLRVLSAVCHSHEAELERDYPSWIPTWQRHEHNGVLGIHQEYCRKLDAHAGFSRGLRFTNMNKTIQVDGFAFDTIDEYTKVFELGMVDTPRGQVSMHDWPIADALALQALSAMPTRERLENLVKTLIPFCGSSSAEWLEGRMRNFAAYRLQLWRLNFVSTQPETNILLEVLAGLKKNPIEDNEQAFVNESEESSLRQRLFAAEHIETNALLPEGIYAAERKAIGGTATAFVQESEAFAPQQRLFTTKSGLVGLGPRLLRSGDVCCILYGGHVPFLFRPVGSAYKLVGEIYMHKMMQGEAVVDFVLGDMYEAQTFNII